MRPLRTLTNRLLVSRSAPSRAIVSALVLVLGAIVAVPPQLACAQDADGGTQSVFTLGVGSRAFALGRAFMPVADDASAIYWNPAALRNVQSKQIMAMYMPLFGDFTDATYSYLGLVWPTLSAGSIGVGFQRLSTEFEGFDASSVPTGTQDYSDTQILIGYAFEHRWRFTFGALATGVNFKIANQRIGDDSGTSPGVDLGFQYRPDVMPRLSLGLHFQDLVGPEHRLNTADDQTPQTIMTGIGYTHPFSGGSALRVMLQLDSPERADSRFHAGAEFVFARYAAVRVGLDDGDFAFGLGVNARGFGLDYAMLSREDAGSSHPVTFTIDYGNTLYEQRQIMAERQAQREQELIQEAFNGRVQDHRDRALENEAQGALPEALDEWKIVLGYIPGDEQAVGHVEALKEQLVAEQARVVRDMEKQASISAHFAEGLAYYQESDYARSRREWEAVLEIDSTHAEAREYLARTQEKINEQLAAHVQRAGNLEGERRYTEAIGEWNNVQALDPGNARAEKAIVRIQGLIETQSRNLAEAAKRLEIANMYNTALQSFNEGRYEEALGRLDEVLRLAPDHEDAKSLRATAKRKMTPLTEAEEQEIRRLYLRGMQFYSKDQYAEAIGEWEKILDIDPTNESVKRNIDEARERLKQLGQR